MFNKFCARTQTEASSLEPNSLRTGPLGGLLGRLGGFLGRLEALLGALSAALRPSWGTWSSLVPPWRPPRDPRRAMPKHVQCSPKQSLRRGVLTSLDHLGVFADCSGHAARRRPVAGGICKLFGAMPPVAAPSPPRRRASLGVFASFSERCRPSPPVSGGALHCIALHCIALLCFAWFALHCFAMRCFALRCPAIIIGVVVDSPLE